MKCKVCKREAAVGLKSHNAAFCEECFLKFFRRQVERGIHEAKLLEPDDKILVALSGGKDSLVLISELLELGYNATGLFIDLGIPESSEPAREHVRDFCSSNGIPLMVEDMRGEGLAIPAVKKATRRPICSICGKIKRHYFNKAAISGGFDALATGHNLDDEVARLFSNILRWDKAYLAAQGPLLEARAGYCRKVKPLWRLTEFETANCAFIKNIKPHWAPCPYSEGASFSTLKSVFQDLELQMPGRKLDFYQGFLKQGRNNFKVERGQMEGRCESCGAPVNEGSLCGVCRLREMLASRAQENA